MARLSALPEDVQVRGMFLQLVHPEARVQLGQRRALAFGNQPVHEDIGALATVLRKRARSADFVSRGRPPKFFDQRTAARGTLCAESGKTHEPRELRKAWQGLRECSRGCSRLFERLG